MRSPSLTTAQVSAPPSPPPPLPPPLPPPRRPIPTACTCPDDRRAATVVRWSHEPKPSDPNPADSVWLRPRHVCCTRHDTLRSRLCPLNSDGRCNCGGYLARSDKCCLLSNDSWQARDVARCLPRVTSYHSCLEADRSVSAASAALSSAARCRSAVRSASSVCARACTCR